MAASVRTLYCSVLKHSTRSFNTACVVQAGHRWRTQHGLSRSGTEFGPMTDLPDWSFADGRLAPPLKGHLKRREQREALSRRIVMLNSEIDKGIETWERKQEEAKQIEELKKSLLLKPKGKLLLKKK